MVDLTYPLGRCYGRQDGAWVVPSGASLIVEAGGTVTGVDTVTAIATRVVNLATSTAITAAAHDSKVIVMGGAGSARTFTLPASTGSGARFRFMVGAVNTSNYLIKSVAGADHHIGTVLVRSDNSAAVLGYTAGATDDTVTLNGSTTGGAVVGDWLEYFDAAANSWLVTGIISETGAEATPFSDTVT